MKGICPDNHKSCVRAAGLMMTTKRTMKKGKMTRMASDRYPHLQQPMTTTEPHGGCCLSLCYDQGYGSSDRRPAALVSRPRLCAAVRVPSTPRGGGRDYVGYFDDDSQRKKRKKRRDGYCYYCYCCLMTTVVFPYERMAQGRRAGDSPRMISPTAPSVARWERPSSKLLLLSLLLVVAVLLLMMIWRKASARVRLCCVCRCAYDKR